MALLPQESALKDAGVPDSWQERFLWRELPFNREIFWFVAVGGVACLILVWAQAGFRVSFEGVVVFVAGSVLLTILMRAPATRLLITRAEVQFDMWPGKSVGYRFDSLRAFSIEPTPTDAPRHWLKPWGKWSLADYASLSAECLVLETGTGNRILFPTKNPDQLRRRMLGHLPER